MGRLGSVETGVLGRMCPTHWNAKAHRLVPCLPHSMRRRRIRGKRFPCFFFKPSPLYKRLTEWDSRGGAETQMGRLDFYKKSRANTSSMLSKFTDPPSDATTGSVVLERRKCRVQSHIPALFRNFLKSSGEGDEVNFTSIPHFCPPASIIKSTS